jgi:transaldolase
MIFLDSSKIEEIKKYRDLGIIKGVTTNPTIMTKDGVDKSYDAIKQRTKEIANIMRPHPVSIEVLTNDHKEMIRQAKEFSKISPNINIKVTFHGPNGELDNLRTIAYLEQQGIKVNCTAMMNAFQLVMAAQAGATYVSLFGGRVNNMGYDTRQEIEKAKKIIRLNQFKAYIILGSVREPLNIMDWLVAGADIITVPPSILEKALVHPYTKETVQMFEKDGKNFLK